MSLKSQRSKSKQTQNQTLDTSYQNKSHSDKRTSRFLASLELNNENSNSNSKQDNPEKAFFILLDACSELVQLHNDSHKQEIDQAIKQNQTFEQVAIIVHSKLQLLKRDYVTSEYQLIQLKESIISKQQQQNQQNSFDLYQKLHDQNQRWKQLYFQEARQLIEVTKQQKQFTIELQQQLEYINILELKQETLEQKYLELFELIHSSNQNQNIDIKKYCNTLQQALNDKTELLSVQLQNSRKQCIDLSKRLQDEIMKVQAAQELRIVDMQYIMSLENSIDQNN
ncbi:unnamed protein product [Paramecium pentaurelia]|uniref:Uncharacterized protein n=1 Tax=Paramecium pentaurelia TaxID=43138 RepID=A0A8S1SWK2_9CILI|nr:unnamed protein product [Paramecium pentaurelia]